MNRLHVPTLTVALVAGLVSAAAAQEGKGLVAPKGPPPLLAVVAKADATTGLVEVQVTDLAPETRETVVNVTEERNGMPVVVPRKQTVTVLKPVARPIYWRADAGQALDGEGKPVAADKLWQRLKAGAVVLHLHGDAVDPAWLQALKPETVVLLSLKPQAAPKGPAVPKGP